MIDNQAIVSSILPSGVRHTAYAEVVSTNSTCLELARSGDDGNHWVSAEKQTSGKGSRGRSWDSLTGNLFASLLLKNPSEEKLLATLTFVASLAIRDLIVNLAPNRQVDVRLKWPNDVLLKGKKLSGILLENHQVKGDNMVIVGIGINVQSSPKEALFPAISLKEFGIKSVAPDLFFQLAQYMQNRLDQWDCGLGFENTKEDWLKHAAKLGEQVQVKQSNETLNGIFEGLSEDGRMLLKTANGQLKKISTADIFFA